MPVKGLLKLSFLAASMLVSASSFAQEQPRSMLGDFDLKSVILSPAPLGPPSQFEPKAATQTPEATSAAPAEPDTKPVVAAEPDNKPAVAARAEAKRVVVKSEPAPRKVTSSKPRQKSAVAARKPKANPLDSYARDARRQTWPCTGGGICAWTTIQVR